MEHKIVYMFFIFIVYSFIGWLIESIFVSIKNKKLVNRGILNGPICTLYGFIMVITSIAFFDTTNIPLILIGSIIYVTFVHLTAGKLINTLNVGRLWDYSNRKFNLEGYVCIETSLLLGVLTTISILYLNPLLNKLFYSFDYGISKIVIIILIIAIIIDFIIAYLSLTKDKNKKDLLSDEVVKRVKNAYPDMNKKTFADDSFNVYKFFIYLIFGGFLGCMCEMVYCRYTMNIWMSRSSLLYGEISLVWGLAFALFTAYLQMYKKQSNLFLFVYGFILGTAFEYLCGSFCEYLYGCSFWDYNHLPLNINGRVQIVFALIWGFSALIYIKYIYKYINKLLSKLPDRIGKIIVSILIIVLLLDVSISTLAGMRLSERQKGIPPSNIIEEFCDKHYTDDYMKKRFKTLKIVDNSNQ